jgi:hypothetical protein
LEGFGKMSTVARFLILYWYFLWKIGLFSLFVGFSENSVKFKSAYHHHYLNNLKRWIAFNYNDLLNVVHSLSAVY